MIESDNESETQLMDTKNQKTPKPLDNTTLKKSTFDRSRPNLIRDRASPNSPQTSSTNTPLPRSSMGPATITTTKMSDTGIDRAIEDAKCADQEFFVRDENGKVFPDNTTNPKALEDNLEYSELDLARNLSSSTEIETDQKNEEWKSIRRSKRLTKTNPIVKYKNPVCHDYRKHRSKTELGDHTESTSSRTGEEDNNP